MRRVVAGAGSPVALLFFAAVVAAGRGLGGSADRPDGGVVGQVWIGPLCPVVREGEACPDRPLSAPIEVRRVLEGEDPTSGRIVRRLRSDQGGGGSKSTCRPGRTGSLACSPKGRRCRWIPFSWMWKRANGSAWGCSMTAEFVEG